MGLKKSSKTSQNKWFGTFWGDPFGETNLDHADKKRVLMQRGAHFAFSGSVPMQRGARFLIFGVRSMVQHEVDKGVENIYKINAIMHIFK